MTVVGGVVIRSLETIWLAWGVRPFPINTASSPRAAAQVPTRARTSASLITPRTLRSTLHDDSVVQGCHGHSIQHLPQECARIDRCDVRTHHIADRVCDA